MVELETEMRALCAVLEALEQYGQTTEHPLPGLMTSPMPPPMLRPMLPPILRLMQNHLRLLADRLHADEEPPACRTPPDRGQGGAPGAVHGPAGIHAEECHVRQ